MKAANYDVLSPPQSCPFERIIFVAHGRTTQLTQGTPKMPSPPGYVGLTNA